MEAKHCASTFYTYKKKSIAIQNKFTVVTIYVLKPKSLIWIQKINKTKTKVHDKGVPQMTPLGYISELESLHARIIESVKKRVSRSFFRKCNALHDDAS